MWNIVFCYCVAAGGSHSRPSEAVRPVRLWPHHFFQTSKKNSLISFQIPGIVSEIVLLSRRPGNLPNVPGLLANWLRFQAPVTVYDIHTRNATALGERRRPHAVLRNLQNFQLTQGCQKLGFCPSNRIF